ncbi:DUF4282 domain-containing protein [Oceanobacillus senegalensis]|uniref:DUF4282 domain-containing protein n=1 Tax=Oceanobacillus senegalensis TaxID=1936063 RepID=UPI001FE77517|nr:DUF4282 domain-containing protein [Oceanobacillus senegalensis]
MLREFFLFNKMITPTIIKVLFWIGVVGSVIVGIMQFITGLVTPYGGGFVVFVGLLTIVLGPLFARVYCELLILFFKMHETMQEMNEKINTND